MELADTEHNPPGIMQVEVYSCVWQLAWERIWLQPVFFYMVLTRNLFS